MKEKKLSFRESFLVEKNLESRSQKYLYQIDTMKDFFREINEISEKKEQTRINTNFTNFTNYFISCPLITQI